MSDPYERVKGGRLSFKGGTLATRSKSIGKIKHKKSKNKKGTDLDKVNDLDGAENQEASTAVAVDFEGTGGDASGDIYTIDAAKKMKYEELFPVEAKKFRYDPKFKAKSVEDALDDRVKKKADRYCK